MKLTRVGLKTAVAAPSDRNNQPRNIYRVDDGRMGQTGVVDSLELRGPWVVIDGSRAVPLSNVAFLEPPPKKRGRPYGAPVDTAPLDIDKGDGED